MRHTFSSLDDLSFFDYLSPLCFLLIEFHCIFSRSYKILQYYVLNQKILPLDKLINQQEGILANKVINGTYFIGDILTDRHELDH